MSIAALLATWLPLIFSAATDIPKVVQNWIAFVKALAGAGIITAAEQDKLMAFLDGLLLSWAKGEIPPAWTVEPDPPTPATTTP